MNHKLINKFVFVFTAICVAATALSAVYNYLLPLYLSYKFNMDLRGASSIGIIGGADGPTSIYVSSSLLPNITAIFALLAAAGIIYLFFDKRKNK